MDPTVERFRALARSSPWRWSSLRCTQPQDPFGASNGPVRIQIRRPKLARVELLDGSLLRVLREELPTATPGPSAGTGHEIAIEAVDELMGDALFPPPEPARWSVPVEPRWNKQ